LVKRGGGKHLQTSFLGEKGEKDHLQVVGGGRISRTPRGIKGLKEKKQKKKKRRKGKKKKERYTGSKNSLPRGRGR